MSRTIPVWVTVALNITVACTQIYVLVD